MQIYCSNISFKATADDIKFLFQEFGDVTEVKLMTDRESGKSRGFAFITMPDDAQAKRAIERLDGYTYKGRELVVNKARPKQPHHAHDSYKN